MAGSRKTRKQARRRIRERQYRWEFLRRSEDYVRAFGEFRDAYPGWLACRLDPRWPEKLAALRGEAPGQPGQDGFVATSHRELMAFRRRWGIDPTDPDVAGTPFLADGGVWVMDHRAVNGRAGDPDVLTVCIDTNAPLKEVVSQLEWRVARHREQQNAAHRHPEVRERSGKCLEKYDACLRVHDLARNGLGDDAIALALGLDDASTAARLRQEARKLIASVVQGQWPQ